MTRAGAPVRLAGVTVRRGGRALLDNVSLEVESGEKVVVTGVSGSGKSTLLLAILGVRKIDGGVIEIDNTILQPHTAQTCRASLSLIGQEAVLWGATVREALVAPRAFRHNREVEISETTLVELVEQLGLSAGILDAAPPVLSGGEKQRIAAARGLLCGRPVVMADEVTASLDQASRKRICDVFSRLPATVLSVSHDPEWLKRADRILVLEGGTLSPVRGVG